MSTTTASNHAPLAAPRRAGKLLRAIAALAVVLAAVGWFVVKPAATSTLHGVGAVLGGFLQGLGRVAQVPFDEACQRVQQNAEVLALFGDPVECAPIEESEWIDTQGRNELEFKFKITGPRGAGEAHVVAVAAESGFEVSHVQVTGPAAQSIELP